MMKAKWLIEDDAFPEDIRPTLEALERLGHEYKIFEYKISDLDDSFLELFSPEDCVVFYGSLQLAKRIRRKAPWIPGVYYDVPKYDCTAYYPAIGEHLLNENYLMLPFGELVRRKEFLYQTLGQDRALFVRPNRGDKTFTGQLVYKEKFEKEVELFDFGQVRADDLVVVAEPRLIAYEWRFVCVNGTIVAGSQYKENDRVAVDSSYPQEAFDFATEMAQKYQPEPAWVIDVCKSFGEYSVMEIGCFSCAGLYQCDRDAIIESVSTVALEEWESYQ